MDTELKIKTKVLNFIFLALNSMYFGFYHPSFFVAHTQLTKYLLMCCENTTYFYS